MPDAYVKHTADDFAEALAALLPRGEAWKRDPDTPFMDFVAGLAEIWGDVAQRADDLLVRETDPRATLQMLPDWERAFGLPDPCVAESQTIEARQAALVGKMTTQGGQSRVYFENVAASLGYTIYIREYSPFMCGLSRCGDTRSSSGDPTVDYRWHLGPPEMRFYWTVAVSDVRLSWFRVGGSGGQCGVDPMLRIGLATDLECRLRQWKPGHTDVIFDYSGINVPRTTFVMADAATFLVTEGGDYLTAEHP